MAFKKIEWDDDKKLTRKDLVDLMPFALENGRHEFISEFIEREDVVESYMTVEELRRLYQKALNCILNSYSSSCKCNVLNLKT